MYVMYIRVNRYWFLVHHELHDKKFIFDCVSKIQPERLLEVFLVDHILTTNSEVRELENTSWLVKQGSTRRG